LPCRRAQGGIAKTVSPAQFRSPNLATYGRCAAARRTGAFRCTPAMTGSMAHWTFDGATQSAGNPCLSVTATGRHCPSCQPIYCGHQSCFFGPRSLSRRHWPVRFPSCAGRSGSPKSRFRGVTGEAGVSGAGGAHFEVEASGFARADRVGHATPKAVGAWACWDWQPEEH